MDIRQLIEHAFQKLKLVTLYQMEQLIINTYTSYIAYKFGRIYLNKMGSMIWVYKSISNILQIKIAIYMKWQAFVQINYYVSKKKYCNMLQWFIVGLLAFEGKFKMHLLSFSKLMYRFRTLGLWFMIKQLPLQRLTCIFLHDLFSPYLLPGR